MRWGQDWGPHPGCPEVGFGAITPSGEFQSEVVVYGLAEFLLAAKIAFSCFERMHAPTKTESAQVLRPLDGITVRRCDASHGEQDS